MTQNLIGQSLDNFKITALLGKGGMGAVYKGLDVSLQRDVAIKVMHPHFSEQENFRQRFQIEARATAQLNHPGIVGVYHFGQSKEWLYIAMEFIPGGNLAEFLRDLHQKRQWIVLTEAVELIRRAARALDYSHKQGVLHRDIKPANIMLKPISGETLPYTPVITDLGLAKLEKQAGVTQTGSSMGTPAYMSPEQAIGEDVNAQSDIYSLGILLFELALGQRPFAISTLSEAIRSHTNESPPFPQSLRLDIPDGLSRIILRCLEKNPQKRFASAGELANALSSLPSHTIPNTIPPKAQGASSLKTQYAQSIVKQRGRSVIGEFPSATGSGSGAIQILKPDRTITSLPISNKPITVGRDKSNQIILNDSRVSGRHLRIECNGHQYFVTDLNSTNGTSLNKKALLPGVREEWHDDQPMRVGKHYLRLVKDSNQSLIGTVPVGSNTMTQENEDSVKIYVEKDTIAVNPGQNTVVPFMLHSQSSIVGRFAIKFVGLPTEWVHLPPPIDLMPGAQKELSFSIHPPFSTKSIAKSYTTELQAVSQNGQELEASRRLEVEVLPFTTQRYELTPQVGQIGQPMTVQIHNESNLRRTFRVDLKDKANLLEFVFKQPNVTIDPGQSGAFTFEATETQRRWFGQRQTHALTATITASGVWEPESLIGSINTRPLIPLWVSSVLLALLVTMGGSLLFLSANWRSGLRDAELTNGAVAATEDAVALLPPTDTPVPSTIASANMPTDTLVSPTDVPDTPTNTSVPPTDTPTSTPIPPTDAPTPTATSTPNPPTDTPTSVPNTPINTPVPKAEVEVSGPLNVRSGPGTSYDIIGPAQAKDRYLVTGKSNPQGEWWQIKYREGQGWVFGQLVTEHNLAGISVVPAPELPPTVTPTPTSTASITVNGLFSNLWSNYRDRLGPPLPGSQQPRWFRDGTFAEQPFDGGHMFGYKITETKWQVFVTMGSREGKWTGSGTWYQQEVTRQPGSPDFACPQESTYHPTGHFGIVWCTVPRVRSSLGRGLASVRDIERECNGDCKIYQLQEFEGGFILQDSDGNTHSLAYVFFSDGSFVRERQ